MNVVFCWTEISGYMAACWRALMAEPGIELFIVAHRSGVAGATAAFRDEVTASLPIHLLDPEERENTSFIASLVASRNPDVIVLPGWAVKSYTRMVSQPGLAGKRFVMFMDTPHKGNWRQRLARLKIGAYLDRMDGVFVTGERSWQFARALKVPESKIRRGAYGIDFAAFSKSYDSRAMRDWPRRFLFMGRYASVKGIAVLLAAYARYRATSASPWPLTCHGAGPLSGQIKAAPGVTDGGFIQPADQPDLMTQYGVFVLPSLYDPWPLVIVEAAAAGLPVICSEACGSSVEVVRPYFNGLTVATGDEIALAEGMAWAERHWDMLPEMGRRGQCLAAAYSAQMWVVRWVQMFSDVCAAWESHQGSALALLSRK